MVELMCPVCNTIMEIDDEPDEEEYVECPGCESLLELQQNQRAWVLIPVEDDDSDVEGLNVDDLRQLPGVTDHLAKTLKQEGYVTLWEIADETNEILAAVTGISKHEAKQIIIAANRLLRLDEDEEYGESSEENLEETDEDDDEW